MIAKPGDFLLTKEKQLYRIMDVFTDTTGTYYDIKSYRSDYLAGAMSCTEGHVTEIYDHHYIRAIPRNKFRHLGKIIPENEISKIVKVLYG